MPFKEEHAARVRQPGRFEKESFRRKNISSGVYVILGKEKGESGLTAQSYRFKKDTFTAKQARDWLTKNNIKILSFEAAI